MVLPIFNEVHMSKMLHVSVPTEAFLTHVCKDGKVIRALPKTARGETYNVGKNAAKRAKRAKR
jgi:hypothetical protein